jgi:rhodanese-related sulfurtransferase
MKKFTEIVADYGRNIDEIMPWDLEEKLASANPPLLLDIREPYEFDVMHINGSLNVPRGILESACEYNYEETVPELVESRHDEIIVICRSGNRSILAAYMMNLMGYEQPVSLRTGLRGWNDYEMTLVDSKGKTVSQDQADEYFTAKLRPEQVEPAKRENK